MYNLTEIRDNVASTTLEDVKLYLKIRIILSFIFIIILLLLCCFIHGLTEEIQHFNFHAFECCQFYN